MTDLKSHALREKYEDLGYSIDAESFKGFVLDRILNSRTILAAVDNPLDMLYLLEDEYVNIFTLPVSTDENPEPVIGFFEQIAMTYEGKMNAYIYMASVWALSIDMEKTDEVDKYTDNPELVLENPFKQERLIVIANGWGQTYDAYQELERDDNGVILFKDDPVIEDSFVTTDTVADLLLPVLK